MRLVSRRFDGPSITLIPLSDLHVGSPQCDTQFIKRRVLPRLNEPSTYAVGMGDTMDVNLLDSVGGGAYWQTSNPEGQLMEVAQLLYPYRHKILGMVGGNHEARVTKSTSYRPEHFLGRELGGVASDISLVLHLVVGRLAYVGFAHHGASGATTKGGKIAALDKLWAILPSADFVLAGHTHTLAVDPDHWGFEVTNNRGVKIGLKQGWAFVCGHSLRYGGYGEAKAYSPTAPGAWAITLHGADHGKPLRKISYEEIR